ncbi:hypothetical protein A4X06_0g978 [Tilletia controversa]|uniref:CDP-diacylglycerol--glycerol-3-phosphate 3-phosphatidyltransferase n=1 Tax=Tilletia controversa TaxID=13291 RepID=A0A8X7T014_9BASI|nr:hypothetical protein CF328_g1701 [Tilletia controversa]KAE8254270.1 hypothetical protein A4X06_0g978 [Tilletia controversa]
MARSTLCLSVLPLISRGRCAAVRVGLPPAPAHAPRPRRRLTTSSSSSSRSGSAAQIAARLRLPCFPAHSQQLHLLPSPTSFHSSLLSLIQSAQSRILLSSLYIGPTESELVHTHLRKALSRNPGLRCTLLLDALRSTREGLNRPSSASLVAALVRDFPGQVDARLHLTPRVTSSWLRKLLPKRFGEGLGLQHMKLYVADDSLIISGANLSQDYFTNRQDRYLLVKDHAPLSDYVHDLIGHRFARHAYRLEPAVPSSSGPFAGDAKNTAYTLVWDGGDHSRRIWSTPAGSPDQAGDSPPREYAWASSLSQDLLSHTNKWEAQHTSQTSGDEIQLREAKEKEGDHKHESTATGDVQIVPLLQLGTVGLTQETDALHLLLSEHLSPNPSLPQERTVVDLTTGYFSPSPSLVRLLLRNGGGDREGASILLRVLTASPRSNGFFGSSFPSGLLPAAYVLLERAFANRVGEAGWRDSSGQQGQKGERQGRVLEMRRWEKEGWTYHAKGIWITPPSAPNPTITLLGSSNYGRRSAHLDAECTFLISTTSTTTSSSLSSSSSSANFGTKLGVERDALLGHARVWNWQRQLREQEREEEKALGIKVTPLLRVLTWALKGML